MIVVALIGLIMLMPTAPPQASPDTTRGVEESRPVFYYYGTGESDAPPPGMMRVRERIDQIRGRGTTRVIVPYPVYLAVPRSLAEDGAAAFEQPLPLERAPAFQQHLRDGQPLEELSRQLTRRFDTLESRMDRLEDLYYEMVWRDGSWRWREDEPVADPLREADPEAPDPLALEERPELRRPDAEAPAASPMPRALTRYVERALLETGLFRTADVVFEFDRSTLLTGSERILDAIGEVLERYDDIYLEIAGHTDNIGSAEYNQRLSEARAATVRNFLVSNYDIDPARLASRGYGLRQPLFSNETPTGRTLNRRVEFVVQDGQSQ